MCADPVDVRMCADPVDVCGSLVGSGPLKGVATRSCPGGGPGPVSPASAVSRQLPKKSTSKS